MVAELERQDPVLRRLRHLVRPGLTGWAQVKYQYAGTEAETLEKLQYEFFYLRRQSLGLDLRIVGADRAQRRRAGGPMSRLATVTVVIPTFNEEEHLGATLRIDSRRRPTTGIVEVIVADGRSTDRTREVAVEFAGVRIVDNPARAQSAGLNRAIEAARGDIIVRVDGHCVIERRLRRAVCRGPRRRPARRWWVAG